LDDNVELYGRKLENREIVTSGMPSPKDAARLRAELNKYSAHRTVASGANQ